MLHPFLHTPIERPEKCITWAIRCQFRAL